MLTSWRRRTAVLIGDELIVTRVQLSGENFLILATSGEEEEWSRFSLRQYEVSFLESLKYRAPVASDELLAEDQPCLMILYEKSGVIAMSVVLKDKNEMNLIYNSLKLDDNMHMNIIQKNSYLEDKFSCLPLNYIVPTDYFEDEVPPRPGALQRVGNEEAAARQPMKFKMYQGLVQDLKSKKILISSVNGSMLFSLNRTEDPFFDPQKSLKDNINDSLRSFLKGYIRKVMEEYNYQTVIGMAIFYLFLMFLSVFTLMQLTILTIAIVFAIIKFDMHLIRVKEHQHFMAKTQVCKELYCKRMVSFSRPEIKDYLEQRTKKIRLHEKTSAKKSSNVSE